MNKPNLIVAYGISGTGKSYLCDLLTTYEKITLDQYLKGIELKGKFYYLELNRLPYDLLGKLKQTFKLVHSKFFLFSNSDGTLTCELRIEEDLLNGRKSHESITDITTIGEVLNTEHSLFVTTSKLIKSNFTQDEILRIVSPFEFLFIARDLNPRD